MPHQHLGYLWPMGPCFWAFDQLGVPDWVAQRLWLGTLTMIAALGARWLVRSLGLGRAAALAGPLVYALTPYQLAFTARTSVLLLPWAGLPWLVELTRRAVGRGGWRAPAGFALVTFTVAGVNAEHPGARRARPAGRAGHRRGPGPAAWRPAPPCCASRPSRFPLAHGGWWRCTSRAPGGSTSWRSRRTCAPSPSGPHPTTCCGGWATGTSTVRTAEAEPSIRPATTTTTPPPPSLRRSCCRCSPSGPPPSSAGATGCSPWRWSQRP